MKKLSLIIKREFISKVRNKSFIVMTFLSPLLFVCIAVLVGYLSTMEKENASSIAIHDASGVFVKQFKNKKNIRYIDLSFLPFKIAKDTAAKSYDGLLYIPSVDSLQQLKSKVEYISEESPSLNFVSEVEQIVDSILTSDKLNALGFDSKKIEDSRVSSSLKLSKFSGGETVKGLNEIKLFIGGAFGYLIMMFIVIYGNFVMRSVIEEKTNRIIEIIISSVKPFQLMMGKIIGNALAGLLQFIIWAIMGGVLFFIFSYLFGFQVGASVVSTDTIHHIQPDMLSTIKIYMSEILTLPLGTLFISFLLYFAGGYFLYSSFYAAIGAAVDSETDSQQFLLPIILPLILGVYIGFFTVLNDPHGTVATIFSIFPLTSPIVMLMRIPFGVPIWQLLFSLIVLFTTFLLVVWLAAKIYRIGILIYGKKPSWKELYKWLKY